MAATPKVLLAEDDTAVAAALTRVLRDDFDVVDVVADGVMLIEQVNHLRPDVILSDVSSPGVWTAFRPRSRYAGAIQRSPSC